MDVDANLLSYERHRATGRGWPVPEPNVEILDVCAEQEAQHRSDATEEASEAMSMLPTPLPSAPAGGLPHAELETRHEGTEQTTPPLTLPPAKATALPRPARRSLEMMADTAKAYGAAAARPTFTVPVPPAPIQVSLARSRALEASRSDIFAHSVAGRGHWSVGPRVAPH